MSKEAAREFRALVASDESLQVAVRDAASDVGRLIALGTSRGYDFTVQELEAVVEETELSDLELELVSGGAGLICGNGGGSQG